MTYLISVFDLYTNFETGMDAAVHFYTLIGFEKQYLKNTNIYGVFIEEREIRDDYPLQWASTGLETVIVPLKSVSAADIIPLKSVAAPVLRPR